MCSISSIMNVTPFPPNPSTCPPSLSLFPPVLPPFMSEGLLIIIDNNTAETSCFEMLIYFTIYKFKYIWLNKRLYLLQHWLMVLMFKRLFLFKRKAFFWFFRLTTNSSLYEARLVIERRCSLNIIVISLFEYIIVILMPNYISSLIRTQYHWFIRPPNARLTSNC